MPILLNVDAGELEEEPEELVALAHLVHVACGGHAGDGRTMERTVRRARAARTTIGAHPSYPDREGFGRRTMVIERGELCRSIEAQCRALRVVAEGCGASVTSAKPHGALYHDVARDPALAAAVLDAIVETLGRVEIVTIAGAFADAARARGLVVQREGFADRGLRPDGTLVPRGEAGAMIDDPGAAAVQARRLAASGTVDTLCVHGDGANPLAIVRAVRRALAA